MSNSVTSITFTVTDPDTLEIVHQHQIDMQDFRGYGPLMYVTALGAARRYRDGYFAAMGWHIDSELPVEGGVAGDASVGMGDMVDWSILGDK